MATAAGPQPTVLGHSSPSLDSALARKSAARRMFYEEMTADGNDGHVPVEMRMFERFRDFVNRTLPASVAAA